MRPFATKFKARVPDQSAGQQPSLTEDLETVAYPDDRPPTPGETHHLVHDRREAGDRAATEIVSVGEPARKHNGIKATEVRLSVPHDVGTLVENSD
jgi:hypothetical protein